MAASILVLSKKVDRIHGIKFIASSSMPEFRNFICRRAALLPAVANAFEGADRVSCGTLANLHR